MFILDSASTISIVSVKPTTGENFNEDEKSKFNYPTTIHTVAGSVKSYARGVATLSAIDENNEKITLRTNVLLVENAGENILSETDIIKMNCKQNRVHSCSITHDDRNHQMSITDDEGRTRIVRSTINSNGLFTLLMKVETIKLDEQGNSSEAINVVQTRARKKFLEEHPEVARKEEYEEKNSKIQQELTRIAELEKQVVERLAEVELQQEQQAKAEEIAKQKVAEEQEKQRKIALTEQNVRDKCTLIHRYFGHMGMKYISTAIEKGWVNGLSKLPEQYQKHVKDCPTCKLTNIAMRSHGREKEVTRATAPLQILYLDFFTFPVETTRALGKNPKQQDDTSLTEIKLTEIVIDKVQSWADPKPIKDPKYALIITDDYTRYTWCLFSHTRTVSDILIMLKEFFQKILPQVRTVRDDNTKSKSDLEVRVIHCDKETGFISNEVVGYCRSLGIHVEPLEGHHQYFNGIVERTIGSLKNIARKMLVDSKLPMFFWSYALRHAAYIRNLVGVKTHGKHISPHYELLKEKVNFKCIQPFGTLCYVHRTSDLLKRKHIPAVRHKAIFLGYEKFGFKEGNQYVMFVPHVWSNPRHSDVANLIEGDIRVSGEVEFPNVHEEHETHELFLPMRTRNREQLLNYYDKYRMERVTTNRQLPSSLTSTQPTDAESLSDSDEENQQQETGLKLTGYIIPEAEISQETNETEEDIQMGDASYMHKVKENESIDNTNQIHTEINCEDAEFCKLVYQNVENTGSIGKVNENNYHYNKGFKEEYESNMINYCFKTEHAKSEDFGHIKQRVITQKMWDESDKREMLGLKEKNVMIKVKNIPDNTTLIDTRIVRTVKENGTLKSRLVAKGYEQIFGKDYFETFSAVISLNSFRMIINLVATTGWDLRMIDVSQAYIQSADLKEEIYINVDNELYRLLKPLYGLKQAGRCWYKTLTKALKSLGLRQLHKESCMFVKNTTNGKPSLVIGILVDDILVTGEPYAIDEFHKNFSTMFKISEYENATSFNGIEIIRRGKHFIQLTQGFQVKTFLKEKGVEMYKSYTTPEAKDQKWIDPEGEPCSQEEIKEFQSCLGSLHWFQLGTRPDLSHICHGASTVAKEPTRRNLKKLRRALGYLKTCPDLCLTFNGQNTNGRIKLSVYTDSDHAGQPMNKMSKISRKSTLGHVIMSCGPIAWKSKYIPHICSSSAHSEIASAFHAFKEIRSISLLMEEIGVKITHIPMFIDNASVVRQIMDTKSTTGLKHVEIAYCSLKEKEEEGVIRIFKIPSEENISDIFTKAVAVETFVKLRNLIFSEKSTELCDRNIQEFFTPDDVFNSVEEFLKEKEATETQPLATIP